MIGLRYMRLVATTHDNNEGTVVNFYFFQQSFYKIVTKDFYHDGGQACVNSIKKSWKVITTYGETSTSLIKRDLLIVRGAWVLKFHICTKMWGKEGGGEEGVRGYHLCCKNRHEFITRIKRFGCPPNRKRKTIFQKWIDRKSSETLFMILPNPLRSPCL